MQGARGSFHLPVRQAILCRERFETVPYGPTLHQACPVLDTGKDEGNAADACLPVGRGVFQ
jgi:hypothetical protein